MYINICVCVYITHTKLLYPEYMKNIFNSIIKTQPNLKKKRQKMSIDTLQRRYLNGPISTRKEAQQH